MSANYSASAVVLSLHFDPILKELIQNGLFLISVYGHALALNSPRAKDSLSLATWAGHRLLESMLSAATHRPSRLVIVSRTVSRLHRLGIFRGVRQSQQLLLELGGHVHGGKVRALPRSHLNFLSTTSCSIGSLRTASQKYALIWTPGLGNSKLSTFSSRLVELNGLPSIFGSLWNRSALFSRMHHTVLGQAWMSATGSLSHVGLTLYTTSLHVTLYLILSKAER